MKHGHREKARGIQETITVRRVSYGIGTKKVFRSTPNIVDIETVRPARFAGKLYYLRDRVGKTRRSRKIIILIIIHEGIAYAIPPFSLSKNPVTRERMPGFLCFAAGYEQNEMIKGIPPLPIS